MRSDRWPSSLALNCCVRGFETKSSQLLLIQDFKVFGSPSTGASFKNQDRYYFASWSVLP